MINTFEQWQNAYADSEKIQRWRPTYSHEFLNNPHKGTATFQRFEGDPLYPGIWWKDDEGPLWFKPPKKSLLNKDYPPTRISYCRWLWNIIEPKEGEIRFDIIDGALQAATDRGQTLQLRIQPFIKDSTPDWYWKKGGKAHEADSKAQGCAIPDHNDPLYLEAWGRLTWALGERYDGHPALESVDVAYGGACGETGGNCQMPMAHKLVDVYLESFTQTPLIGMLGTDGNRYLASHADRYFGWRADCYGDYRADGKHCVPDGLAWNHMNDAYPSEMFNDGVVDAWRHSPVTLETCWTVAYWEKQGWDIDEILAQGYKYHLSVFMPKSVYIPSHWMDKIMEFNKRIGYRFFIHNMVFPRKASIGGPVEFKITVDNRGCAPIYRPYQLALRLTQEGRHWIVPFAMDIRKWMPDFTYVTEAIQFPSDMNPGSVALSMAIVDEQNKPAVKLAHKERLDDGWYPVSFMSIERK